MNNIIKFLAMGILILILIIITLLIIGGVKYTPKFKQISIDPMDEFGFKAFCQSVQTSCNVDEDCKKKCDDNIELKCVDLDRTDPQAALYGASGKFCLPEKPAQICNTQNGGIWAWTGWSSTDRMEWDCLCTYPQIAGGAGCELNPNVCNNGTWSYDAINNFDEAPNSSFCKCPDDYQKLETIGGSGSVGGYPICVQRSDWLSKTPEMATTMYSNTKVV